MKKIMAAVTAIVTLIESCAVVFAGSENMMSVNAPAVNGNNVTLTGSITSGKKGSLLITVNNGDKDIYSCEQNTDSNGTFTFNFDVPKSDIDEEYAYTIIETEGESVVETLHSDDFTTSKSYTVQGEINDEKGNPAPSEQLINNSRLLKQLSESPSGQIDISGDFYITDDSTNTNIVGVTAAIGNTSGIDTSVNKTDMFNAFEVVTQNGNVVLKYADNATEQTTKVEKTIIEDFSTEQWYNLHFCMDTDSLKLKAYVNDAEVLEEEDKYIFKQLDYKRIFDTKKVAVPVYVDNVLITKTVPYEHLNLEPVTGTFTIPAYEAPAPTPMPENTYNINITDIYTADHVLSVKGEVEPQAELKLVYTVTDGDNVIADGETASDDKGEFRFSKELPKQDENKDYTVKVALKEQSPNYEEVCSDDFLANQQYMVKTEVTYDEETGHDAPSAKLVKGSRLLKSVSSIVNKTNGIFESEMEFMKPDKADVFKIFAVFDTNGDNMTYLVYSKSNDILIQYRDVKDGNLKSSKLIENYETNKWYKLKGVINLSKRKFDFYVDDKPVKENLPIAENVTNVARVMDVQSSDGTIYVDNLRCVEDTTVYFDANDATKSVTDAGSKTIAKFLEAIENANKDTVYSVINDYKDVLYLDLSAYGAVNNDDYINSEIAGNSYADLERFKTALDCASAFAVIKESTASNIIENISGNMEKLAIVVPDGVLKADLFKKYCLANIASIDSAKDLNEFIENACILTALKNSTQFKVKEVIDEYKEKLTELGLTRDFFALSEAQAITAAKAVFKAADEGTDVSKLLQDVIDRINKAVTTVKGSGSSSSGGGGSISSPGNEIPKITAPSPAAAAEDGGFKDLPSNHWAYGAIMNLVRKNIMDGVSDELFMPDGAMTREQFVKVIVGTLGMSLSNDELPFTDLNRNEWYYSYISTAYNNGLINGVADDSFGIGHNISRQDAAVILYRAKDRFELSETKSVSKFADDEQIADYAAEAVYFLSNCGVINGNDYNEFMPSKLLKRAEAATLMNNIINTKSDGTTVSPSKTDTANRDKAGMLLSALGIEASFADEYVTKGEWASILAKTLKRDNVSTPEDYFDDISSSEYKNAINTLASTGIIPKSQSYHPDSAVTLSQAVQNVVYALGWGLNENYQEAATMLDLYDSIKISSSDSLDKESCIWLLYNMLNAKILYQDGNNSLKSDEYNNLLGSYYDVTVVKGRVTANTDAALPDNKIKCGKNQIVLDDILLYTGETDIDEYLGYRVEAFVQEKDDEYTVICFTVTANNDTLLLDIPDIESAYGFDSDDGYEYRVRPVIKYSIDNRSKNVRLSEDCVIVYNNRITQDITDDDFVGNSGTVMLIDSNGDGDYDLVSMKCYKAYVVSGYDSTSETISFKNSSFILELSSVGEAEIYKNGRKVEPSAISKDDILCLYSEKLPENKISSSDKVTIYISNEIIQGMPERVNVTEGEMMLDGQLYKVMKAAAEDITAGKNQKFYLDICRVVVQVEDVSADNDYVYVLKCFADDSGEGGHIKYMTKDENKHSYPLAKKVIYTGYDLNSTWTERKKYSADELRNILEVQFAEHTLAKISVENDEIIEVTMAENMTKNNDYKGYTKNKFTLDDYATSAVSVNDILTQNYRALSGTTLMVLDYTDANDEVEVMYYAKSDYNNIVHLFRMVEKMYVYDSNENLVANVCVLKINRGEQAVTAWNINDKNVVVVDSINMAVDNDNEIVYQINGYSGGQQVSYYTKDMEVGATFNTYWRDQSSKSKVSELTRGDVIMVAANTSNKIYEIVVLSCVCDFKDYAVGYGGSEFEWLKTTVGPVWKNYDNETMRLVGEEDKLYQITGTIYLCDMGRQTISVVGKGAYINDSDTENPDYVFIRKKKGIVSEIVIYRF